MTLRAAASSPANPFGQARKTNTKHAHTDPKEEGRAAAVFLLSSPAAGRERVDNALPPRPEDPKAFRDKESKKKPNPPDPTATSRNSWAVAPRVGARRGLTHCARAPHPRRPPPPPAPPTVLRAAVFSCVVCIFSPLSLKVPALAGALATPPGIPFFVRSLVFCFCVLSRGKRARAARAVPLPRARSHHHARDTSWRHSVPFLQRGLPAIHPPHTRSNKKNK